MRALKGGRERTPNRLEGRPVLREFRSARSFVREVLRALRAADGPAPRWRLEDPISCLVGTILAQATTDALADRAYRELRRRFPTWARVLDAPRSEVERAIRLSGLARQKAEAIQGFLRHLRETRGKLSLADLRRPDLDVDAAIEDLSSVKGVGVKTAAVTLMFACGADLCAVDTHVARILRRLGLVPEAASPERAFRILRPLVPPGSGIELHLCLIRHGRTICAARKPRCGECPLARLCAYAGAARTGSSGRTPARTECGLRGRSRRRRSRPRRGSRPRGCGQRAERHAFLRQPHASPAGRGPDGAGIPHPPRSGFRRARGPRPERRRGRPQRWVPDRRRPGRGPPPRQLDGRCLLVSLFVCERAGLACARGRSGGE